MNQTDRIEDVYSNDIYDPFLIFCQEHRIHTMQDLAKFKFERLSGQEDISPALFMRIKAIFAAYCKKHPDLIIAAGAPKARPAKKPETAAPETRLKVKTYFEQHADTLVRTADVAKALGIRRGEVTRVLEQAPWCRAVDAATFFYVREDGAQ